jgi:hypothetical protein
MTLVPGGAFIKQIFVKDIENLQVSFRNSGTLKVLETLQEVRSLKAGGAIIIFFSYECLQFNRVAPNEAQLKAMKATIYETSEAHQVPVDKIYMWLDCFSIPQTNHFLQQAAINSIYCFASIPNKLVIVCPESTHSSTGRAANDETVKERFWCRLEQLAFFCRQGRDNMFLHRGSGLEPLPADWLDKVCCIYNSSTTCCRLEHDRMRQCDREKAVLPLLALYHDVFERSLDKKSARSEKDEDVLGLIQRHKSEMFPDSYVYKFRGQEEQRTLFGQMIGRIEAMLKDRPMRPMRSSRSNDERPDARCPEARDESSASRFTPLLAEVNEGSTSSREELTDFELSRQHSEESKYIAAIENMDSAVWESDRAP